MSQNLSFLAALINPEHPAIADHAAALSLSKSLPEDLTAAFGIYKWVGTREMTSYDDVIRDGKGNCLTLSAMLAATAIASGWDKSCILVSGGGLLSQTLIVTENNAEAITVHAWAILVPYSGTGSIIDPVLMKPEPLGEAPDFDARLKFASPVDKIMPIVISSTGLKVLASTWQAHAYLEALWKR